MDKISDLFKDLKERLSSPFFSSYLIAWSIYNWRIVIGLIFLKSQDLKDGGYHSYFDLVERSGSGWKHFIMPLIYAFGYTFLFPFFRNWVLIANAWFKNWGNNRVLKVSQSRFIPITKFLVLRDEYMSTTDKLVQVINDEKDYLIENGKLATENASLELKVTEVESEKQNLVEEHNKALENLYNENSRLSTEGVRYFRENEYLRKKNRSNFFEGRWKFELKRVGNSQGPYQSNISFSIVANRLDFYGDIDSNGPMNSDHYSDKMIIEDVISTSFKTFISLRSEFEDQNIKNYWTLTAYDEMRHIGPDNTTPKALFPSDNKFSGIDMYGNLFDIERK